MKELVIISGKGGVGKTSVTAAFAALAGCSVIVDCDVDSADLHLLMRPEICHRETFVSGKEAIIRVDDCIGCGKCQDHCRFEAIQGERMEDGRTVYRVDPVGCEGCGVCLQVCPQAAIDFPERTGGEWFVSATRFGPMVHAWLTPGGENSGKLVSTVRNAAREIARKHGLDLILIDGPPGIGCPVIASLSGASQVLIVTEPTLSGRHDMARTLELTKRFSIPAWVCVNKWDINPEITRQIEDDTRNAGAAVAGRIRYDSSITEAQIAECPVVELDNAPAAADLRDVWAVVSLG
jgi:MinD superfamily P-loop ATPase